MLTIVLGFCLAMLIILCIAVVVMIVIVAKDMISK